MPSLQHAANGGFKSRKRIPDDVRADYQKLYGQGYEAKLFIKGPITASEARSRYGAWLEEVETRITNIRRAQRGEGIDITRKQALALAGEWYNWFIGNHEDEPGKPEHWDAAFWRLIEAIEQHASEEVRQVAWSDLEWTRDPEVRKEVRPVVADMAYSAQFLAKRGVTLTTAGQSVFLDCVLDNYIAAVLLLERRAKGDYSRDELPDTFPTFDVSKPKGPSGPNPWNIFETWVKTKQPAQSTVESWRTFFKALAARFPDSRADAITPDEAQDWLDSLIGPKRSAHVVRNWLRAMNAVYRWAKKRKLIRSNPFEDAAVDVPRRKQATRSKSFDENECRTILRAASAISDRGRPYQAAQRWVPWLQAYTGARPSEIAQLRGEDVQQVDGVWALNLTPEAGTIKNNTARRVPLHEHLIAQGFLKFVKRKGKGPLFYRARAQGNAGNDPTRRKKPPAAQVRQRLAAWVREVGVKDKHVSPNHAWRHTFKLLGDRAGIQEKQLDYICGHAPASEGRGYGKPTLSDMAKALRKFPRYSTKET